MQEMEETGVHSPGWEDPLEEGMATHSSILAWRIPWTREPGGCGPWGHTESDRIEGVNTRMHADGGQHSASLWLPRGALVRISGRLVFKVSHETCRAISVTHTEATCKITLKTNAAILKLPALKG